MKKPQGFISNSIHAGESETTSATPIYLSATAHGRYMRGGNPTLDAFEEKIRTLDGGAMAISTACGMAAICQTLLTLLKPGDRLVSLGDAASLVSERGDDEVRMSVGLENIDDILGDLEQALA